MILKRKYRHFYNNKENFTLLSNCKLIMFLTKHVSHQGALAATSNRSTNYVSDHRTYLEIYICIYAFNFMKRYSIKTKDLKKLIHFFHICLCKTLTNGLFQIHCISFYSYLYCLYNTINSKRENKMFQ